MQNQEKKRVEKKKVEKEKGKKDRVCLCEMSQSVFSFSPLAENGKQNAEGWGKKLLYFFKLRFCVLLSVVSMFLVLGKFGVSRGKPQDERKWV